MSFLVNHIKWFYHEFGIGSVYDTGRDAWLVILARSCRMFAFGATSLIIAVFFSSLKFSDFQIGLFMTLTLAGDVLLSLFLTLVADRIGRRRVLLAGAFLMIASGVVFALAENFVILLLAAVFGVVSAIGGDFGPFRAIEESIISHLTTSKTRPDVLSWYVTASSLGLAAGTEFSGRAVEFFQNRDGWTPKQAYHAVFWLYVGMGMISLVITISLSDRCESVGTSSEPETSERLLDERQQSGEAEDEHDVDDLVPAPTAENSPKRLLFTQISPETRSIMYRLWFLLTVDSLADGMVSYSLTYYYMDRKLHLPKSTLGDITSISHFLAFLSTIFASPLARRLGLINTMVFTHLPSSIAVLLFPIPQGAFLTVALFFVRTGLNNMDQAPRSAFIAAVVKPEERTAVMGITSTLRTLASTVGPSITGTLAGSDKFWIAFVVAGVLRICYDLGLFALFVNLNIDTRKSGDQNSDPRVLESTEDWTELSVMKPASK